MVGAPESLKSATLQPPRKSIELEDPGAHDLETSENEDDVFSDAREGHEAPFKSRSREGSPIPVTRVEKVDEKKSHGDVGGTAASKRRSRDAVPDELKLMSDGGESGSRSSLSDLNPPMTPGGTPIPKTIVEVIDATHPSHGQVPGTAAYSIREADAVPDVIVQVSESEHQPTKSASTSGNSAEIPVPTTVVTKVDSQPSHGEVPGTEAYDVRKGDAEPDVVLEKGDVSGLPMPSLSRSSLSAAKPRRPSVERASPIAADGGFGPMEPEESQVSDNESDEVGNEAGNEAGNNDTHQFELKQGFGDDFDDFKAGAVDEDFGDFDEPQAEEEKPVTLAQSNVPSTPPFPLVSLATHPTLADILSATNPHLDALFPTTTAPRSPAPAPISTTTSQNPIFLTPRSHSLWTQLVSPPPLQPPNWVRSRTRRLFLVSLGVPIDLDEILPASKQKKLILPSTIHLRSDSPRSSSASRLRQKQENSSSYTSLPLSRQSSPSSHPSKTALKKRKGPPPPPPLDISLLQQLCATTDAALEGFSVEELELHVLRLEEMTEKAGGVLEYWLRRKDGAVGDKEAFEGVIGNLVRFARRVRK